ncbi:MAG TPA: phospholipid carrier-dependent glycosyltransferase [Methylomirabilota bacterium]|nr:phospholipid carrier-dependent glycosyltransferase [Methylomirabilota bacterium]
MNRWSALAVLVAIAGALALRVPQLETRPLHNDEAVNAVKVSELWQHGRYAYDPDEYHGPTLHYATLPFLWLSGAHNADDLKDATLRLAPVVFGVGLILLLLLFVDGMGRHAVVWAALFLAISPAMVFYSRYFIHEMLLVFFTALTLGAGWRYIQARSSRRVFPLHELRCSAGVPPAGSASVSLVAGSGGGTPPKPAAEDGCATPVKVQGFNARSFLSGTSLPFEGRGKSEAGWAVLTGIGLGLMFTTKETFVLTLAAMGLAGIATVWWTMPKGTRVQGLRAFWNWKHVAITSSAAFIIWLLLFSSFFTNFAGLLDSARTYLPWLKRAGGHSPHIHPWSFYLERLAWFHPAKGPVWSEGLILILATVGAVVSLVGKKSSLLRFLALYTIILTGIYSAISYKTPWCLLNFYLGMILLAGVGAAALVEFFRARFMQTAVLVVLLMLTLHLSLQAWCVSFGRALKLGPGAGPLGVAFPVDWRNPYVYAQTVPDLLNLVQRTEGIARVAPAEYQTVVKVIAPESDYWPLPWYLRRFKHIGWYDKLPDDPFAPIVVVSSKLDARLDEKSERKWIMVGLTELRPGKFFEQYVELELWKKYVETLPRERE